MNKKIKITLLVASIFTIFLSTNVYAEENDELPEITTTTCEEDAKKSKGTKSEFTEEECLKAANKCIEALYPATFNLKVKSVGKDKFEISLINSTTGTDFEGKYKFKIEYVIKSGGEVVGKDSFEVEADQSKVKKNTCNLLYLTL